MSHKGHTSPAASVSYFVVWLCSLVGGCFFDSNSKKRKLFPALARLTITSFRNDLHLLEVVEVAPLLDTKLSLESHMCSCSQTRPGLSIVEHVRECERLHFYSYSSKYSNKALLF